MMSHKRIKGAGPVQKRAFGTNCLEIPCVSVLCVYVWLQV